MKLTGYGFAVTNAYLVTMWLALWFVPLPRTGPVYEAVFGITLVVAIVVLILFVMMFAHMLRSGMTVGKKVAWCVVFFVTSIVGSTAYYLLVFRHSERSKEAYIS